MVHPQKSYFFLCGILSCDNSPTCKKCWLCLCTHFILLLMLQNVLGLWAVFTTQICLRGGRREGRGWETVRCGCFWLKQLLFWIFVLKKRKEMKNGSGGYLHFYFIEEGGGRLSCFKPWWVCTKHLHHTLILVSWIHISCFRCQIGDMEGLWTLSDHIYY